MIYETETITVADTAIGFTAANLALAVSLHGKNPTQAICTLSDAQIRFWEDGSSPTTTVGHIANIGDVIYIRSDNLSNFRAIRTGNTSGKLSVSYEV